MGLILQIIFFNESVSKLFLKGVRFLYETSCKSPLQLAKWPSWFFVTATGEKANGFAARAGGTTMH